MAQSPTQFVEYSAKFLCGAVGADGPSILAPGVYNTSINIHNPQLPLAPLPTNVFAKKVVISQPEGKEPLAPSQFQVDKLQADFAEEVDCNVIRSIAGAAGKAPFLEGFVVLISVPIGNPPPFHELDVVGVYTVMTPQGQSISLEMEPIAPRFLTLRAANAAKMRRQLLEAPKK
jgi:hypothetical protein